MAVVKCSQ